MSYAIIAAGALLIDALLGDPRFSLHPVRLMGRLAERAEAILRQRFGGSFVAGLVGWLLVVGAAALSALIACGIASAIGFLLGGNLAGRIAFTAVGAAVVYFSIAPRDLASHALAVKRALEKDGLEAGRKAVSMIVGRDVEALDEAGVVRACVESVAESAVDGVAAPLFWAFLLGPGGALAYRAANTLDSMWGHKDERYLLFGRFAARADDVANWLPARVAFFLSIAAAALLRLDAKSALLLGWRDRRKHESPNAAWLEASFAGALGLRLGGPCSYSGALVGKPYLGEPRREAETRDIGRAVALMYATVLLFAALCSLAALALSAFLRAW